MISIKSKNSPFSPFLLEAVKEKAGLIPPSISNLKQIESLDLSHNKLNGRIPAQLVELKFLKNFNVSYNNFSGRTPEMKNQFATWEEISLGGNLAKLFRFEGDRTINSD